MEYKKRLHYITDSLLSSFQRTDNPEWKELIETYLKYLDKNVYQKLLDITNITNINNVTEDVFIQEFFNQYANGIINEELIKLDNDTKKQFIIVSNLINNLKGTKASIEYLLRYGAQTQVQDLQKSYILEDLAVNISPDLIVTACVSNPRLFDNLFTYQYETSEVYDRLPEILETVNPAGVGFSVYTSQGLDFTETSTISISATIAINLGFRYNGLMQMLGVNNFVIGKGDGDVPLTISTQFVPIYRYEDYVI